MVDATWPRHFSARMLALTSAGMPELTILRPNSPLSMLRISFDNADMSIILDCGVLLYQQIKSYFQASNSMQCDHDQ